MDHPHSQPAVGEPGSHLASTPVIKDVWSRSGSKYRIRAVVLLAVNVLLFAGVGSFAFWLRSGQRFAPGMSGYWDHFLQTFRFAGGNDVSLGLLLLEPISVQDVPMQIPILGLLMAALISIPILVAMLYRFWASLPLLLVVGFVAVMPWLAITLLISCILASFGPFRTRYRFVSALVGLVPAVIYLALAWRGSAEVIAGRIDPADGIKFVAPWVLAIVAAAAVFAIVLTIARLVDYRPGAITPLLTVMFVLPAALFEFYVGRDELYYRLLESLNRAHFAPLDASGAWREAARRAYARHPLPRPDFAGIQELQEQKWLFELASDLRPFASELARHRAVIADRCDWFIYHFPYSRYASNALYLKARALDMRVDTGEFRRSKWIRFYEDFPSVASRATWEKLHANRPDSVLGAVAAVRVAQLDARECDVDRAAEALEEAAPILARGQSTAITSDVADGPLSGVLSRAAPEASLEIPVERLEVEARRLYQLLKQNRDPIYGYDPLCGSRSAKSGVPFGLLDLNPRHERYAANLARLIEQYPNCQLRDNIFLEMAKAAEDVEAKVAALEECLDRFADRDAAPEAMLQLAIAYRSAAKLAESERMFQELQARHPDSIWAREARHHWPHAHGTRLTHAGS